MEIGNQRNMKLFVDWSPKCHPEVAGEGIEYAWAQAKSYIRRIPISRRRAVDEFKRELRLVLSSSTGGMLSKQL